MAKIKIAAESGINHDGSTDKAAAVTTGSQAIKFQYRNLDNAYSSGDPP